MERSNRKSRSDMCAYEVIKGYHVDNDEMEKKNNEVFERDVE